MTDEETRLAAAVDAADSEAPADDERDEAAQEAADGDGDAWGGHPDRTEASVARVVYRDLARGTLERYLEPGESIDAPADRVTVEALSGEGEETGE